MRSSSSRAPPLLRSRGGVLDGHAKRRVLGREESRGGHDRVRALAGNDRVFAGRGNDRVSGGDGRDRLVGGPGRDRLFGGAGNDLLIGGGGRDRVRCGPGRDRAILDPHDVILDATAVRPDGSCEVVRGGPAQDAQLIAAGDIADCGAGATVTTALLDNLPGTVATLGDTVYQRGTPEDWWSGYDTDLGEALGPRYDLPSGVIRGASFKD